MRMNVILLSAARSLAVAGLLAALSLPAGAAALFTLKGNAQDAKLEDQSEVRVSVLGWTAADSAAAIVEEYRKYQESQDHAAFDDFLQQQETKGYLFTKAATGYTIKYAWQPGGDGGQDAGAEATDANAGEESAAADAAGADAGQQAGTAGDTTPAAGIPDRMVLLVTPGLKTRNPYLWNTPNGSPAPFSLVEIRMEGEEAVVKTSLDDAIEVSPEGHLQLQAFDTAATFARVLDDTPYYLKDAS